MGAVLAAPIGAVGSCAGSCAGTFLAAGCCKLAFSGEVSAGQAVRCLLVWLQAFIALTAVLSAALAERWLPALCTRIAPFVEHAGVCECHVVEAGANPAEVQECWREQSLYRAEAGGTLLYSLLLLLSLSGCKDGASRSYSIGKFMVVVVLWLLGHFLPNSIYSTYGWTATVAASVFLVAQSVFLMDFAYTWNETWNSKAEEARRREVFGNSSRNWLIAIVVASVIMLIIAVVIFGMLLQAYSSGHIMTIVAMGLSLLNLLISITEWCEHGNLLTSCLMALYVAWLMWETLALMPEEDELEGAKRPSLPSWIGLLICFVSLVALMSGLNIDSSSAASHRVPADSAGRALTAAADGGGEGADSEETGGSGDRWGFALHCCTHAAATLYISAALAPSRNTATFVSHSTAVFIVIALYAWTLVAPKVLTDRQF